MTDAGDLRIPLSRRLPDGGNQVLSTSPVSSRGVASPMPTAVSAFRLKSHPCLHARLTEDAARSAAVDSTTDPRTADLVIYPVPPGPIRRHHSGTCGRSLISVRVYLSFLKRTGSPPGHPVSIRRFRRATGA